MSPTSAKGWGRRRETDLMPSVGVGVSIRAKKKEKKSRHPTNCREAARGKFFGGSFFLPVFPFILRDRARRHHVDGPLPFEQ